MNYLNLGIKAGVTVFGTTSLDFRLRGAKVTFDQIRLAPGATVAEVTDDVDATPETIPGPGEEGWDISAEAALKYDGRANWYGISTGDLYKFTLFRSLPALNSDFRYWGANVQWVRARKFWERHNFIIKATAKYGHGMPFQQEYVAGGTDLRGYKNSALRGNLKLGGTAEYSVPVFTVKGFALRALAFVDSTYIGFIRTGDDTKRNYLPGYDDSRLGGFRNTVGVGTRVYLRSVVLPLLGLDIGYSPEIQAHEIYFAIGLTDL